MTTRPRHLARLAAGAALAALTLAPAAQAQDSWVLKYGHVGPVTSDDQVPGEFIKACLEPRSQGRITVEIYPAAQLGNFRELIEQVQFNTLELTHTTVGGAASFLPELQVTDIPYMMRGDDVAEAIAQGPFMDRVRDAVLEASGNVRLVAVGNTGRWRSFFTADRPIRTAADLDGIKMRTINSPLQIEFVRQLGGNPTPVAWGELYTSLQTGVVEGTKNAATDIIPTNMHEVLKHVVLDQHAYLFAFWWMSDQWLQSLPADLQDLVIDCVAQASQIQSDWNKEYEARSLQEFRDAGGTVYVPTAEEKETFMVGREAMKEWFVGEYGDEWLTAFEDAVAEAEAAIAFERDRIIGRN